MAPLKLYLQQTSALIHKNVLLFARRPLTLLIRVLCIPIAIVCVLAYIKSVGTSNNGDSGIASSPSSIKTLAEALQGAGTQQLILVRNGLSQADPIISAITTGLNPSQIKIIDSPALINTTCRTTVQSSSNCFAAVVFNSINATIVDYQLAFDQSFLSAADDWRHHNTPYENRILPLQFAVEKASTGLDLVAPKEVPFSGNFYNYNSFFYTNDNSASVDASNGDANAYYAIVSQLVAPFFYLIIIDLVIMTCSFIVRERENGITELLSVHGARHLPQILSNFVTFWMLYLPTLIITGAILSFGLFIHTSVGLTILLQVLAGTATICCCLFLSSLFNRAAFAGPVSAVITFICSALVFNYLLREKPVLAEIRGLAAVFPPFTYSILIADIARTQAVSGTGFSLSSKGAARTKANAFPVFDAYLYPVFFCVQIVLYLLLTVAMHKLLWNPSNKAASLPENDGVAVRCEDVSKTYNTRRWYWPFMVSEKKLAVSDLNFEVNKGAVVCLLGPNGGGKTTCLKGIVGVHSFDKGSKLSLGCKENEYGFCPQTNVIWPELNVRQHLVIWGKIKGSSSSKVESSLSLQEIIDECDLGDKLDQRAGTLSGGQKRKLQLAISFVGGSKVVCIDEASSGLDPLSRQHIWKIIQRGVAKRTILMTTHFLDEADILADYIVIISKGKLMCEGPGTLLKASYGNGYNVYDSANPAQVLYHAKTSAEAEIKVSELDSAGHGATHEVAFPTLEHVFLKVAAGDKLTPNDESNVSDIEESHAAIQGLALDSGTPLNTFQQIKVLFVKRYIVLRHNWLALFLAFGIPIAIAAGIRMGDGSKNQNPANNCLLALQSAADGAAYDHSSNLPGHFSYYGLQDTQLDPYLIYSNSDDASVVLGPRAAFNSTADTSLYKSAFQFDSSTRASKLSREFVTTYDQMVASLTNSSDPFGYNKELGIFESANGSSTLVFRSDTASAPNIVIAAMSFLSNRQVPQGGRQVIGKASYFRSPVSNAEDGFFATPFSIFLALGFIAGFSAAVIYPSYERVRRARTLQYSNGVSPFALWSAYLLFELQIILIVAIVVYAVIVSGIYGATWFAPAYLIGAMILFGIATVLGVFLMSLYFSSKASYPMSALIHAILVLLYFVAYILAATNAPKGTRWNVQNQIQAGFGLVSPGANLARAFFVSQNAYSTLCGTYGEPPGSPFAFHLYGGVYLNLLIQILFLGSLLMLIEYDKIPRIQFRRNKRTLSEDMELVHDTKMAKTSASTEIRPESLLRVSHVSKSFNKVLAVDNVSLSIGANETLALLGPNGAGKTTLINVIRGEFKPDSGEVMVKDKNVLTQLVQARSFIGVCFQDDAVEDMTVQQTLMFYAAIKGVPNREKNVSAIVAALNLPEFKNRRVSKLSGGTKRKLSVAVAILGNPPLLLLDEPSTGQDAASKRALWKTLRDLSHDRAILLTTHSMEEVEALATSVAIVSTSLLAAGTTTALRQQYGGYFHIRALTKNENAVRTKFGETKGWTSGHGQVKFSVATTRWSFGSIMVVLEGLKKGSVLGEYTINGATLEEVFLNVCGDERN